MDADFDLKNVRLEAVAPRDAAKLLKFIRAYYLFEDIPFDHQAIASCLSLLLNNPALGAAWFILSRGKRVGYLILTLGFDLEFGGRQATLTDLYIEAPHRRKGIGRTVVTLVEEFCRSHGVKALELQVTGKNAEVLDFYRGIGFEAHDRVPMSKRIR
jgi:ribosomal protein S18 acetylase RimI-like enzyme